MRFVLPFVLIGLSAVAQTNTVPPSASPNATVTATQAQTAQEIAEAQKIEKIRATCIENRRIIAGKIIKILPDGLVVDSGYTNLARFPLDHSWLIPGTVTAMRATNVIESNYPDSICIGPVFLMDLPKRPIAKPKLYDYVSLEAFPTGQYTYNSVGDLQRTVRRFSTRLPASVEWALEQSKK